MYDREKRLFNLKKTWGLTFSQIHEGMNFGSIDTVKQLGRIAMSSEFLDEIEKGMRFARQKRLDQLQSAG